MLLNCIRFFTCVFCLIYYTRICSGQFINFQNYDTSTQLPFPTCRSDGIQCLRRGLRTFFFLMDTEYVGMKSIDPLMLNSLTVALPGEQLSLLMRRINVTGAKWTKLVERKFNLPGGKNSLMFISDLHVTGEISMMTASRVDPYFAQITMDIQDVESNITYAWAGQRGFDNEDYILLGPERVAVRNARTPSFFLTSGFPEDEKMMEKVLLEKPTMLEHISNEITVAVMHSIVDNIRHFARSIPARHYYRYQNE